MLLDLSFTGAYMTHAIFLDGLSPFFFFFSFFNMDMVLVLIIDEHHHA